MLSILRTVVIDVCVRVCVCVCVSIRVIHTTVELFTARKRLISVLMCVCAGGCE